MPETRLDGHQKYPPLAAAAVLDFDGAFLLLLLLVFLAEEVPLVVGVPDREEEEVVCFLLWVIPEVPIVFWRGRDVVVGYAWGASSSWRDICFCREKHRDNSPFTCPFPSPSISPSSISSSSSFHLLTLGSAVPLTVSDTEPLSSAH